MSVFPGAAASRRVRNPRDVLGNAMEFGMEEARRIRIAHMNAQRAAAAQRSAVQQMLADDDSEDSSDEEMRDAPRDASRNAPIFVPSDFNTDDDSDVDILDQPGIDLEGEEAAAASSPSSSSSSSSFSSSFGGAAAAPPPPTPPETPLSDAARHLKREGFVVIPCIATEDVPRWRAGFREALASMPEFKEPRAMLESATFRGKPVPFVGGGFSALGNPSSFHNAFVRRARQRAHRCVMEAVFGSMLRRNPELQFEQVIDRMMFRRAGQSASAEAWHRDEAKFAQPGDSIFGGWINLDTFNQKFSGVPRSHIEVGNQNGGFATIPKSQHAHYRQMRKSVEIPPGHIFIFYERMVHEVVGKKLRVDQHRLFLGWRTTYQTAPLTQNLENLLERQAVVPIKSGQIPPMYPKLYWTNWRDRILVPWSDAFVVDALKKIRVLMKTGQQYNIVPQQIARGLVELKMGPSALCPAYTPAEKQIYYPSRAGV